MKLIIGQKAPSINSFDSERNPFSLTALQGHNVVLHFFPAAFTSTCTKQLCTSRDDIAYYNTMNAKVIGISTDSVYVLHKYKQEQNLNFSLVSDYNKIISFDYGAQYETFNFGMQGTSRRAAFVIDKNGIIRYAQVLDNASDLPDFNKIKEILNELK